jgi:hypothetical protein
MSKMKSMKYLIVIVWLITSIAGCQGSSADGTTTEKTGIESDTEVLIKVNRTEGVAPLAVSFDITNTVFDDDDQLMLAEFMWDFGDEDDDYNIGKGYCPSHVYRELGTYTAEVTAYYNGTMATSSVEITVSEFSGTTYYISTDGSDANDGLTESTPLATVSYAKTNFLDTNVQFLLRQGDTFVQDSGILIGKHGGDVVLGPVIFSSYVDPDSPSDNKPIIYDTRDDTEYVQIFAMLNVDDFRIVNIKFQGAGGDFSNRDRDATYPSGVAMSAPSPSTNCLILDCDIQGAGSISIHPEGDYHVVQDCTVRDGGSYGVYMGWGTNCAFIGLSMKEFAYDSPEYTMRLSSGIIKNYVAYNDLWGDYTKSTFQIRGDDSSYNYVWNNQFDRFAGINQTNNEEDETLHHNTFDSNIAVMRDYEENTDTSYDSIGFFFSSNNSMVRNNIVYGFDHGFGINTHDIVGGCDKLWYHNNTVIALRENANFITMPTDATNIELRNNIFYNLAETSSYDDRFISVTDSTGGEASIDLTQIDSDFNIFIGEGWSDESSQTLIGVAYYADDPTFEVWQSDFNNDLSSKYAAAYDAEEIISTIDTDDVTSSLDYGFASIMSGSPAIGMGDPDTIYTRFDFFGDERNDLTLGAIGR